MVAKSRQRLKNPIYRNDRQRYDRACTKRQEMSPICHNKPQIRQLRRRTNKYDPIMHESQQNGYGLCETSAPRPQATRSTTTLKSFPSVQQVVGAGETKTLRYTRVVSLTVDLNLCLFGLWPCGFYRARFCNNSTEGGYASEKI